MDPTRAVSFGDLLDQIDSDDRWVDTSDEDLIDTVMLDLALMELDELGLEDVLA